MLPSRHPQPLSVGVLLLFVLTLLSIESVRAAEPTAPAGDLSHLEWMLPNAALKRPFAQQEPIRFVSRGSDKKLWESLGKYWNETTEDVNDPVSGAKVTRKAVLIKLPLGLNLLPPVPPENPMTVARWELGKRLYFDKALSSNGKVACASCHSPETGFTDRSRFSTGINGLLGGMSAPTVINSAYNRFQFWDGRGASLEDQAQGPVQNAVEMFDAKGHAWNEAIKRIRALKGYEKLFELEFGHPATRDAVAKAIATYERTVLAGNAIQDRAEVAMRTRVTEEDSTNFTILPKDYETVLKAAFAAKDNAPLEYLGLNPEKDAAKAPEVANRLDRGRILYFGKAKCSNCHVGESFTDGLFHNLGVGVVDGKLPLGALGRFGSQPTGHKDPSQIGAFKTPPLRALQYTNPYMHDGSEATLEAVVDFYDRGGNANEYLDLKMRDVVAEAAYEKAMAEKKPWKGAEVKVFTKDGHPIIPLKLGLTADEKKDLVLFLRALESGPVDAKVADPKK